MNTLPPEGDLRPATRERQRAELMAIVGHESADARPRRLLVPLAAAAAIALIAGAAIAVPALRDLKSAGPAGNPTPAALGVRTAFEPIDRPKQTVLTKECGDNMTYSPPARQIAAFRATNPPADAVATQFVVMYAIGDWKFCGYDANGKRSTGGHHKQGDPMMDPVEMNGAGGGSYVEGVARITITPLGGHAYEADLQNGFFFASVPNVPFAGRGTDSTPMEYMVRAYDASGALIYTSPKTRGERRARDDRCAVDATGEKFLRPMPPGFKIESLAAPNMSTKYPAPGMPDPETCIRAQTWNWLG
ncbi:hypothetical protein E0H75_06600 [Kribbella capetownensis]|uniref:Uncharacterized protein n=1 Tax=Kribbella capetownensis TaxID=1572659 RepID=A0A4R0K0E7_9ACTN|nr:hypothetical protein [Kribbella capetownensis]TCC53371.1 hypothetical protein E0H75_06600 [Kribbella capetownensis]